MRVFCNVYEHSGRAVGLLWLLPLSFFDFVKGFQSNDMSRDLQQGRVIEATPAQGKTGVQPLGIAVVWTQESQWVTPSEI